MPGKPIGEDYDLADHERYRVGIHLSRARIHAEQAARRVAPFASMLECRPRDRSVNRHCRDRPVADFWRREDLEIATGGIEKS